MIEKVSDTIQYFILSTEMHYNSLLFFSFFLLFLCIISLLQNHRAKMVCILIANAVFYLWACGITGFCIIFLTALIVYLAARKMGDVYAGYDNEKKDVPSEKRGQLLAEYKKNTIDYLLIAFFLIIGMWVYVKVGKLYVTERATTFYDWFMGKGILVPLGISYYTLSSIGYLLDVYWRKTKPEYNFFYLFTAMTYFPHIVQGPIGKYQEIIKKLRNIPEFDYKRVCFGLQLMLWGYIKKTVIADRLALFTSIIFTDPADFAGVEIFMAVILSVFQLYADFSGCMDIVRGASQAIGIDLDANFRQPFFAKSVSDFWSRWHITLGAWVRAYIFLPVSSGRKYKKWGRNLKKELGTYSGSIIYNLLPMFLAWLFMAFWHGPGWGYAVWGIYWFLLMMLSQVVKPLRDRFVEKFSIDTGKGYYRFLQGIRTTLIFAIGRMFTVAGGLGGCAVLWRQLFAGHRLWTLFDGSLYNYGVDQNYFFIILVGIIIMILVDWWHEKGYHIRQTIAEMPLVLRWLIYFSAMLVLVFFGAYGTGYNAAGFIYAAF